VQQECSRSAAGVQQECSRSAAGVQQECSRSAAGVELVVIVATNKSKKIIECSIEYI
jgi:hypothetical protein